MSTSGESSAPFMARTAWARSLQTPLRSFLRTQTGSAAVLLGATIAALVWANVDASSYERLWTTRVALEIGGHTLAQDVRGWVNSGLMTFFFFIVGLEARREFDMGELRERRRVALPVIAGIGGMLLPVAIYLTINAGRSSAHGWGAAMSTDTAFALGMLALVGPRFPDRLRAFLLTVAVVDDVVAICVIATVYSTDVVPMRLLISVGLLVLVLAARAARITFGAVYAVLGVALWWAMFESGVDPVVVGIVMGLLTYAHPASRTDLERATDLFRLFREQPTPELARSASAGVQSAISPNERLQQLFHPWTSYVIVPLFALANTGVVIRGDLLSSAVSSPITLGIVAGYVLGKPIGITGSTWLVSRLSRGRFAPPVGWIAVAGGGTVAGIGFTVSILISTLAFHGTQLDEAKLGVLAAAICSSAITWIVFRTTALLPFRLRIRALLGGTDVIVDLSVPVDPERDHIRGPLDAPVTVVEYGDFQCPYCGQAEGVIRELLAGHGDVRYVWRHLPLNDVHASAQLAAEAAEAAAAQGMFWEMHDLLLDNQDALAPDDLLGYAEQLGLDVDRFREGLDRSVGAARIAEDVDSADLSDVSGTPTFFINGLRHQGAYDIATLTEAAKLARARAVLVTPAPAA